MLPHIADTYVVRFYIMHWHGRLVVNIYQTPQNQTGRTRTRTRFWYSPSAAMASSTSMTVDPKEQMPPKPPKLVLDEFVGTALSVTPESLHHYFEEFQKLHVRKCVYGL
jgi:hypothetical protein